MGDNAVRQQTPIGQLRRYVRPYRWVLATAVALAAAVGPLEALLPLLLGAVINTIVGAEPELSIEVPVVGASLGVIPADSVAWLFGAMIATVLLKVVVAYGSTAATAYLGHSVIRDLRSDLYRAIIMQPLSFFSRHHTGELISRVSSDVLTIQMAVSNTLAEFFRHSAVLVSLLVVIFVLNWQLSLISLVLVPLVLYPTVLFGRRIRRLGRRNQEAVAEMSSILSETFTGSRIVKIFTMEGAELEKFRESVKRIFRLGMRIRLTDALSSPLMEVLGLCVMVAFLWYAAGEIEAGRQSAGMFMAFVIAVLRLYEPVRRMSGINNSFQQAIGASEKLFSIMALPSEIDTGQRELREFRHSIRFDDVGFRYAAGEPLVLDGVSFSLSRGEMLAVVGSSGAGKTSLVNLIPRFHDVTRGTITVDGTDIREFTLSSLRGAIAMVTQDVILFNDTVRRNIAYGCPDASDEAVKAAARAALVHDFVSTLPNGYDTMIGERGVRLSGGERQRLSIARALLKDAPILILDEATSSLDTESETLVQSALQNLMAGRTTIVIAHRLSTVRRADRILVIADGCIQEEGMHEELILKRGLYWKLHQLQFEGVNS